MPPKREREPKNPDVRGTARDEAGGSGTATGGIEGADVGRRIPRESEESP